MRITDIKGAVFDMDGTLIDSMGIWDNMGTNYLRRYGIESTEELDDYFHTLTTPQVGVYFHDVIGVPKKAQEITDEINALVEDFYRNEAQPKPGARELLEALRNMGVKMCVATANERYITEAALRRCGLMDYFTAILTCTEAGADKNDPEFFRRAAGTLGVSYKDVWVFEDMLHALRTAKAAGMKTVGVYDAVSEKFGGAIKDEADIFVRELTELL